MSYFMSATILYILFSDSQLAIKSLNLFYTLNFKGNWHEKENFCEFCMAGLNFVLIKNGEIR